MSWNLHMGPIFYYLLLLSFLVLFVVEIHLNFFVYLCWGGQNEHYVRVVNVVFFRCWIYLRMHVKACWTPYRLHRHRMNLAEWKHLLDSGSIPIFHHVSILFIWNMPGEIHLLIIICTTDWNILDTSFCYEDEPSDDEGSQGLYVISRCVIHVTLRAPPFATCVKCKSRLQVPLVGVAEGNFQMCAVIRPPFLDRVLLY